MDQECEPYRIRRVIYEYYKQQEPLKRQIIDAAVELGLWEIIEDPR